jgi:hypothetical protein
VQRRDERDRPERYRQMANPFAPHQIAAREHGRRGGDERRSDPHWPCQKDRDACTGKQRHRQR